MRRLFFLMLVLIMCFSMVACRNEKSKEKMLSQATEVHVVDINNDTLNSLAKAKLLYCDKTL